MHIQSNQPPTTEAPEGTPAGRHAPRNSPIQRPNRSIVPDGHAAEGEPSPAGEPGLGSGPGDPELSDAVPIDVDGGVVGPAVNFLGTLLCFF